MRENSIDDDIRDLERRVLDGRDLAAVQALARAYERAGRISRMSNEDLVSELSDELAQRTGHRDVVGSNLWSYADCVRYTASMLYDMSLEHDPPDLITDQDILDTFRMWFVEGGGDQSALGNIADLASLVVNVPDPAARRELARDIGLALDDVGIRFTQRNARRIIRDVRARIEGDES